MSTQVTHVDRLAEAVRRKKSILIAGLDPQLQYMPAPLALEVILDRGRTFDAIAELFWRFNKAIIDAVEPYVIAVKPQIAFYEAYGSAGVRAFEKTLLYAKSKGLMCITDAKRGDGGDTADAYADGHIGKVPYWGEGVNSLVDLTRIRSPIRTDYVTIHPHIGDDCVNHFVRAVKEEGTGIFIVDKTSFRPNSRVEQIDTAFRNKVWQVIAWMVREWSEGTETDSGYRNVGVVMGATYPKDAEWMRKTLPNSWFLVPGYGGGQGGIAAEAVVGVNKDGLGCAINSSRGITYAYRKGPHQMDPKDFALAAERTARDNRDELNEALKQAEKYAF